MIHLLTIHLAQSTVFAVTVGLLTLAFRKNRAQVRYWLWLSASLKFFVPFALLMSLGSALETWSPAAHRVVEQITTPAVTWTAEQLGEPLPPDSLPSPAASVDWVPVTILGVWLCGFAAIALVRSRSWLRIRNAVRTSSVSAIPAPVEVRISSGLPEPGVVGILRPVLLLPEGILERLSKSELQSVLAHEMCHIRRRDNLWASIHMLVEAAFWFHPLVWWLGARLVEERERACDEEVLNAGNHPEVYADAILNVCKLYTESPLACVSGVTGASIKRRIEAIMSNRRLQGLNRAKKILLATAGVAALVAPVVIGLVIGVGNAPLIRAQSPALSAAQVVTPQITPVPAAPVRTRPVQSAGASPSTPGRPKFDAASIRPCQPGDGPGRGGGGDMGANRGINPNMPEGVGGYFRASPGRLDVTCGSLLTMVNFAYVEFGSPLLNNPAGPMREADAIQGVPKWALAARFTIHAETDDPVANGPTEPVRGQGPSPAERLLYGPMLQALLEERFQLKTHRTNLDAPLYALTVSRNGLKLKPMQDGDCIPDAPPGWPAGGKPPCGWIGRQVNGPNQIMLAGGITMERLARALGQLFLDRSVIDRTGIAGSFLFRLEFAPDETTRCIGSARICAVDPNSDIPPAATIFAALEQQLGLKLESIKGPQEYIVIDHVEPPSSN